MAGLNCNFDMVGDANSLIDKCASRFNWGDLSKDLIMDLGCGIEKTCCKALVQRYPNLGRVIAIDKDLDAMEVNLHANATPKIEFHLADIERRITVCRWANALNKLLASHSVHQLTNKEEGFGNMYGLLKPGGEAGFVFCLHCGTYDYTLELLGNPRWNKYYQCPLSFSSDIYPADRNGLFYKEMLERVGFEIIFCEEEVRNSPYESDLECRDISYEDFLSTVKELGVSGISVPNDLKPEFKEEVFQSFLRHNTRNDEGKPCYKSVVLYALVKKPGAA